MPCTMLSSLHVLSLKFSQPYEVDNINRPLTDKEIEA